LSVAKEPGKDVVCHRHASRIGAVPSASRSAVEGVKRLKIEHNEGSFANSINEESGKFKITSRPGERAHRWIISQRASSLALAVAFASSSLIGRKMGRKSWPKFCECFKFMRCHCGSHYIHVCHQTLGKMKHTRRFLPHSEMFKSCDRRTRTWPLKKKEKQDG